MEEELDPDQPPSMSNRVRDPHDNLVTEVVMVEVTAIRAHWQHRGRSAEPGSQQVVAEVAVSERRRQSEERRRAVEPAAAMWLTGRTR